MNNNKSIKKLLLTTSIIILITMSIIIAFTSYKNYKQALIRKQQEQLLTITCSISRSIDRFFEEKQANLSMLCNNSLIRDTLTKDNKDLTQVKELLDSFFYNFKDDIENISLLSKEGKLLYTYFETKNNFNLENIKTCIKTCIIEDKSDIHISKEYLSNKNEYSVNLIKPVLYKNNLVGFLSATINLNNLYNKIMASIQVGDKGYVMIKDTNGYIIMHPVKEQIGIESLKERMKKYPEDDWSGLEELYRKQLEEGEGVHTYYSKWWQGEEHEMIQKICAFTTLTLPKNKWIISAQMDYKEIEEPIKGTFISVTTVSIVVISIITILLYYIFEAEKKRKALEIEARYLKESNKTWNELIKSDARLRHSQKLQTLGLLTSSMVHEFNNLISPILGYSDLLLETTNPKDPNYDCLIEINKGAILAKNVVSEVSVFSREESVYDKICPINILDVVKSSLKLIRPLIPRNIEIVESYTSDEKVLGHMSKLQQVFLNIFTNAYQAMKDKGGLLKITTEKVCIDKDVVIKDYIKISISDTGVGIDKNNLEKIFNPFYTTKKPGEGTGLGLPVVKSIIEDLGGQITVVSQVDIGTTFNIYLPVIS